MGRIDEERAERRCHYCGNGDAVTRDHIVPRAWGGLTQPFNLAPACRRCNQLKASDWPNCSCEHCTTAVARWDAGERDPVTRYLDLYLIRRRISPPSRTT